MLYPKLKTIFESDSSMDEVCDFLFKRLSASDSVLQIQKNNTLIHCLYKQRNYLVKGYFDATVIIRVHPQKVGTTVELCLTLCRNIKSILSIYYIIAMIFQVVLIIGLAIKSISCSIETLIPMILIFVAILLSRLGLKLTEHSFTKEIGMTGDVFRKKVTGQGDGLKDRG